MNASVAVDATGTIYGIATFPSIGSSAFAIGSDGVEKWRTSLGNVGTLDQGGCDRLGRKYHCNGKTCSG